MAPGAGLRILKIASIGLVAAVAVIQLVPYGRDHSNPPVTGQPDWSSPETEALFSRACADCHSNETVWPWYSHIAPVSWLVQSDVDEGRRKFNASEWGRPQKNEGDEAAEMVAEGEMPLRPYLLTHPEARLDAGERAALVAGLRATFGGKGYDDDRASAERSKRINIRVRSSD